MNNEKIQIEHRRQRLRYLKNKHGLTWDQMAEYACVGSNQLKKIAAGHRNPTRGIIRLLELELGEKRPKGI